MAGIGPSALFANPEDRSAGFFGYERTLSRKDLQSDSCHLIVATETARMTEAWTAAGPATVRSSNSNEPQFGPGREFGGNHPEVTHCLFADASVKAIPNSTSRSAVESMFVINHPRAGND